MDRLWGEAERDRQARRDTAEPAPAAVPGFALAAQPVEPQSLIATDTAGLDAAMAQVPAPGGPIPAYWAAPKGAKSRPLVLVVQEIFGLHEHIKDVCRRLAKLGYCAVAPELYYRQGDVSKIESIEAIRPIVATVPDAQVMADLDAAAHWAASTGAGDMARLGVTGFCWGGRITWLYAAHQPKLRAGVAWYGKVVGDKTANQPAHPVELAGRIKAPVLGLYGSADAGIPVETVEQLRRALGPASRSQIHVYPDMPHAFFADYRPSYRADAAKDGWRRMLEWFKANGVS
ncbi:MAG: dienelactone hydrolase family protein [Alphaproteobacteria bacterium]|nr:dienelactone hydrolase family protein [Alphaproteobacteria bacterium]